MTMVRHDEQFHDGVHYPTNRLIAILQDAHEAEQAAQALRDAGFADVVVFPGQQALQAIEVNEQKESPLRRSWERLALELEDEAGARQMYLEALRQGHALVLVYASQQAQVDQAEGILKAHRAHALKFFGRWTITDITS